MEVNNSIPLSNSQNDLTDQMLAATDSMNPEFSFGADAPEALTDTNHLGALQQLAVPSQPATTRDSPFPASAPSALPKTSGDAHGVRPSSQYKSNEYVIDPAAPHDSGVNDRRRSGQIDSIQHLSQTNTQATEPPVSNDHTALATFSTAGSLPFSVARLDHTEANQQYPSPIKLCHGMWQRPAPGFVNDDFFGTSTVLPYPNGFLQGYVRNLYTTASPHSAATAHIHSPSFPPLAGTQVPLSTTARLSMDLRNVIPITQALPPIDTPVDKQLNYIRPPLNTVLTPEEILTFWPNWLASPELAVRMQRNGITPRMIITVHFTASGQLNNATINKRLTDNLKKQFSHGGPHYYDCGSHWDMNTAVDEGPDDDITANNWHTREEHVLANGVRLDGKAPPNGAWWNGEVFSEPTQEWKDMPLTEFFVNVPRAHFPTVQGRGMVTRCLEAVHDDPDYAVLNLTTAHWDWLIKHLQENDASIAPVLLQDPAKNLDQEFVEWFKATH